MTAQRFRTVKFLVAAGLLASLLHFADNTFAIDQYPEPSWITPPGVAVSWFVVSVLAVVALSRKRADKAFFRFAGVYAVVLLGGLLHYAFSPPMHMPVRSNITVLTESLIGIVLASAIWTGGRTRQTNATD
jgi:hypothetical protein